MEYTASSATRAAIVLLCGLAVIATLDIAQGVLAPIISAVVVGVVLSPLADWLFRRGVHPALAAFGVLLVFMAIATGLALALGPSISAATAQAPALWSEVQSFLEVARGAISGIQDLQETVSEALGDETEATDPPGDAASELPIPSLFDALSYGPAVISAVLIFLGTLYFFLASRRDVYVSVARIFPSLNDDRLHAAERRVSSYFLAITFVNAGFGTLVTLAMLVLGMPQPILWGIATFLLNFILYLGPALVAAALLIVGIVSFDGAYSFVPVAVFVMLNMVEAQFVTPSVVGQQMSLNPLLVFLSLVLWLWLWGPVGGLVAIPLLVWVLIILNGDPDA